jgi:hypothetical protein
MKFVANQCVTSIIHQSKLMQSVARRLNKSQRVIHKARFNTQSGIPDLCDSDELRSRAEQSTGL